MKDSFNGKMKAITFSYDDGVTQDKRLVEILNKYNLKCTFNINSGLLGKEGSLVREEVKVLHNKVQPEEVRDLYKGHEVAAHVLHHEILTDCSDDEIVRLVEEDCDNLEKLTGENVVGMAYPCGVCDDRVAKVLKEKTRIKYGRKADYSYNFDLPQDPYLYSGSVYHIMNGDMMFKLGEKFLKIDPERPQLFYIWGHAYEFDIHNTWDLFEDFCKMISNKDDIFYGTNKEVLL